MGTEQRTLERVQNLIAKGQAIVNSQGFMTFMPSSPLWVDASGWRAQTATFLIDICGNNRIYYTAFLQQTRNISEVDSVEAGIVTLEAVKEDMENGYMQTYRQQLSAEFVGDLIEQAEHLHENGFHQAATSIAGAALESGLREVATSNGITLRGREDLNALSDKLKNSSVISELERKQMSFLIGVRNAADHAGFDDVSSEDVTRMIRDTRDFLAKHAT